MFSDEQREKYLSSQKDEEKNLRKIMKEKGKNLRRAESSFDSLTDAEKILINYYFNDENMSLGAAVIKSGLADGPEDAVRIARALQNNKKFMAAVDELQNLGGINPMMIKKGILDIAQNGDNDVKVRLTAWQTLGEYQGLRQFSVKNVGENAPIDVEEIKVRLNSAKADALKAASELIAKLKMEENFSEQSSEDLSEEE